jgi:hypothetical protein
MLADFFELSRSEYASNIQFVEPLRSRSSPSKHEYNTNGAAMFTLLSNQTYPNALQRSHFFSLGRSSAQAFPSVRHCRTTDVAGDSPLHRNKLSNDRQNGSAQVPTRSSLGPPP